MIGKSWLPARELISGDRLLGHDGQWVVVEKIVDADRWATVYNLRVADFHTYFIGAEGWGFSVWAHNTCDQAFEALAASSELRGRVTAAQLALAWVLAKGEDIVPIPGTKRRKYLEENVAAASIKLTPEEVADLEAAVPAEAVVGTRYAEANMKAIDR